MNPNERELLLRIERLERQNRRIRKLGGAAIVGFAVMICIGAATPNQEAIKDEVKTRRLAIVDDAGIERVVISQDPETTERISRSCGITLHDRSGSERGGIGTFEDGSVAIALDAPAGVGHPMRDRLGMKVYSSGAAIVSLMNNETKIPVRLISEEDGNGGVEFLSYDTDAGKAVIKRIGFDGESTREISLGN